MGFLRHIIGLVVALLFSTLGAVAMPMAPTTSHQAKFFPHQEAAAAEHTKVHFAARAPPLTGPNVAFAGAAVAEYGNGAVMHGYETHVVSLRFGANFVATNRTVPRVDTSELISGTPPSRRGAGRYRLGHFDDHAGHGLEARVTRSGELNLSIAANGTRSAEFGSGADMFNSLMRRLDSDGVQVNSIRSEWVPGGQSTNYNQYIDGINSGLSPSQAAANTWTGQRAAEHGFTNITVNSTDGVVSFSFGRP